MSEEFISEPIEPIAETFDAAAMTRGEPGLPKRFKWRNEEYSIIEVLEAWKELGPCRSGGLEKYLRKHWFRIKIDDGSEMTIYFERQPRSKRQNKIRWWLYTVSRRER